VENYGGRGVENYGGRGVENYGGRVENNGVRTKDIYLDKHYHMWTD